jgi:predicted phage terminase large subunit-like protein
VTDITRAGLHMLSPAAFARRMSNGQWVRARHLAAISKDLKAVERGDMTRLMVMMPRQHGKSELMAHYFPAWVLALHPDWFVLLASYEAETAIRWGKKVRNTLTEHYPELGIRILEDTHAGHYWVTKEGGGMSCAGVGGAFTGKGAELLILDDVVKNAVEASSSTIQQRNWDWWVSTFRSGLRPSGRIVVDGTPWDPQDLLCKLLDAQSLGPGAEGYEPWTLRRFPQLAEEDDPLGRRRGEILWPERYDFERDIKPLMASPHWWAALSQLRPTLIGGNLIREENWNYWSDGLGMYEPVVVGSRMAHTVSLPEEWDGIFQSWDMNYRDSIRAVKEGREPDGVSGTVWGRRQANLYLLDRVFERCGLNRTIELVWEVSKKWPSAKVKLVENAANGPAVMAALQNRVGGFLPITPRGSKHSRAVIGPQLTEGDRASLAVGFVAAQQAGNIFLPHPRIHPWVLEYRHNLGLFPKGGRDDTDSSTQAWNFATGSMWLEVDRAHREAKVAEPARTTAELQRRDFLKWTDMVKKRGAKPGGSDGTGPFPGF